MSNSPIIPDLPIIPCYKNKPECSTICNQGTPNELGTCILGSDPEYCSGILKECDTDTYDCNTNITNPGEADCANCFLGCPINDSTGLRDPDCMEFQRYNDKISPCGDICWSNGASIEIDNKCKSMFSDENSCNAMRFFCQWDSDDNECRKIAFDNLEDPDPKSFYKETFGKNLPQSPVIINVKNECPGGLHDTDCIQLDIPEDFKWTLKCAQSSWSSTERTSYAEHALTCCLERCDKHGICDKDCLATPRCQYVEESCDCGFKDVSSGKIDDERFMCSMIQNNNLEKGFGYCTWCQGQVTDSNWSPLIGVSAHQNDPSKLTSEKIEWYENGENGEKECSNRCSNFNQCEVFDSEYLWNICAWDLSQCSKLSEESCNIMTHFCDWSVDDNICVKNPNTDTHLLGVDPDSVTNQEDLRVKRPDSIGKPFCLKNSCVEDCKGAGPCIQLCSLKEDVMRECQTILPGSYTKDLVSNPGSADISVTCEKAFGWTNMCLDTNRGSEEISSPDPISYNFLCDWCPSVQCKTPDGLPVSSLQECQTNCGSLVTESPVTTVTESPDLPKTDDECKWDYPKGSCSYNGEYCEYRFEIGDMNLDNSCNLIVKPPLIDSDCNWDPIGIKCYMNNKFCTYDFILGDLNLNDSCRKMNIS
jgi:hypothetical protein